MRPRVFSVPLPTFCSSMVSGVANPCSVFLSGNLGTDPYAGHFFLGCKGWSSLQLGKFLALFLLLF